MDTPLLRRTSRWLLSLMLLAAGTLHFLRPQPFVQIVPPAIPWPLAAVYLSGAAELLLGIGLLVPRSARIAALGAAVLFIAVFPANVYHWLADVHVDGRAVPGWYHPLRLPMQGVLIAWALWLARRPRVTTPDAEGPLPR